MIDTLTEHLLTLAEAAAALPNRGAGKGRHPATVYRWASRGVRGAVLETIQIGGTRYTSQEALQRFFERLSLGRRVRARIATEAEERAVQIEAELDRHGL